MAHWPFDAPAILVCRSKFENKEKQRTALVSWANKNADYHCVNETSKFMVSAWYFQCGDPEYFIRHDGEKIYVHNVFNSTRKHFDENYEYDVMNVFDFLNAFDIKNKLKRSILIRPDSISNPLHDEEDALFDCLEDVFNIYVDAEARWALLDEYEDWTMALREEGNNIICTSNFSFAFNYTPKMFCKEYYTKANKYYEEKKPEYFVIHSEGSNNLLTSERGQDFFDYVDGINIGIEKQTRVCVLSMEWTKFKLHWQHSHQYGWSTEFLNEKKDNMYSPKQFLEKMNCPEIPKQTNMNRNILIRKVRAKGDYWHGKITEGRWYCVYETSTSAWQEWVPYSQAHTVRIMNNDNEFMWAYTSWFDEYEWNTLHSWDKVRCKYGKDYVVIEELGNKDVRIREDNWATYWVLKQELTMTAKRSLFKPMEEADTESPISKSNTMSDIITQLETEEFFADKKNRDAVVKALKALDTNKESLRSAVDQITNVHVKLKAEAMELRGAVEDKDVATIKKILKRSPKVLEFVKNFGKNSVDSFAVEYDEEEFDVEAFFKN